MAGPCFGRAVTTGRDQILLAEVERPVIEPLQLAQQVRDPAHAGGLSIPAAATGPQLALCLPAATTPLLRAKLG